MQDIIAQLQTQYPGVPVTFEHQAEWHQIPYTPNDYSGPSSTAIVDTPWQYDTEKLVRIVQDQTSCNAGDARDAVKQCDGDIVQAVLLVAMRQQQQQPGDNNRCVVEAVQ